VFFADGFRFEHDARYAQRFPADKPASRGESTIAGEERADLHRPGQVV
jgi:hypothetical protein